MNRYVARFSAAPASLKKSFAILLAAWICHPIFIYSLFWSREVSGAEKDLLKMAITSLSLCLLFLLIKRWARALVVVGNLFIVINDILYLLVMPPNRISTWLCVIVVLCTAVGSIWLFQKASRDYFSLVDPKSESPRSLIS